MATWRHTLASITLAASLLGLSGCSDNQAKLEAAQAQEISQYQRLAGERIAALGELLDKGEVRNATLIRHYSERIKAADPSLAPIVDALEKDGGRGPLYQNLERRLAESEDPNRFSDNSLRLAETENLYQAADPALYNDMLSDPLNALADMSGGTLPRVSAISREAEIAATGDDLGAGSQLIGNPAYGEWQTPSDGTSFWAWYGMYAMFSNLINRPVYYDTWAGRRHYSYYHDVGRYRYSSPRDLLRQQQVFTETKKRFDNQGKRFDSPYAKVRTGASGLSRQSQQAPTVAQAAKTSAQKLSAQKEGSEKQKFRSNYSKSGNYRKSSGSKRSFRRR
ncbi:hypothetical protein KJI95_08445 [Shewanella sp. JM162201]|uniref:Lipoprotein n=1 Tax=Shewanella jiangmenensis TaxID=2837387 RepID=A0ABS5V267_9GAMM|nr:hypothetical protein [Shewanella jiangmenensis]MBT1444558.1 hypothetical protein [Shewanella jiangmenensis]